MCLESDVSNTESPGGTSKEGVTQPGAQARNHFLTSNDRLPCEVWHHILTFLYPSQVARLSRVCRSYYDMTCSSVVWSKILKRTRGLEHPAKLLPEISVNRGRMLYVCAVSGWICEECFRYAVPSPCPTDLATRPLPVDMTQKSDCGRIVAEWRAETASSTAITTLPQKWSIRMCLPCRQAHYRLYPEPTPVIIQGECLHFEFKAPNCFSAGSINQLPCKCANVPPGIVYPDERTRETSRRKNGGDIGSGAFLQQKTLAQEAQKTVDRLCTYRRRYLLQPRK